MTDKQALRKSALQETQNYANKSRFGLFSQPISTAIGDDGAYKTKFHPRQQGKGAPITNPRQFQTGPCRSGQLNSSFFGQINSLAEMSDEFIEEGKRLRREENQTFEKGPKNQNKFVPPSGTGNKRNNKSAYVYVDENPPQKDPKRNRQEDGRVKSKPRNAYTNSTFNVINSYFKHNKHMDDPYDRLHKTKIQDQKRHKEKEGNRIFKSASLKGKSLNSDRSVFGEDVQLGPKESPKEPKLNIYPHQNKWKYASKSMKRNLFGCFSPFPTYIEDPVKHAERRDSKQKKQVFKSARSTIPTPSTSIIKNPKNMRRRCNNSFSHRFL